MLIDNSWRISFELDLILGDLGDTRFAIHKTDPMDIASQQYCRAVAKSLTDRTGRSWEAAKHFDQHDRYLVCPEPTLDPADWPEGIVAGVRLITPPVFIEAAEHIRREIADWVNSLQDNINEEISDLSSQCSWHITVHAGADTRIDIGRLLMGTEELELLITMNRYSTGKASPQLHSYGTSLLRHLRHDLGRGVIKGDPVAFIEDNCGRDDGFAINFEKLSQGSVELRHFATWSFFHEETLRSFLGGFLSASKLEPADLEALGKRTLEKFSELEKWLKDIEGSLRATPFPQFVPGLALGEFDFSGQPAGKLLWDGSTKIVINGGGLGGQEEPAIYRQSLADWKEALALLALDIADIRGRGLDPMPIANTKLSDEIDRLTRMLKRKNLLGPGSQGKSTLRLV